MTTAGTDYTPVPAPYPCSALPRLVADLPVGGTRPRSIYVPLIDYRSKVDASQLKCVP